MTIQDEARKELNDVVDTYQIKIGYIGDDLGIHRVLLTDFKNGKRVASKERARKIYNWCKNYKKAMEYFEKLQAKDEE